MGEQGDHVRGRPTGVGRARSGVVAHGPLTRVQGVEASGNRSNSESRTDNRKLKFFRWGRVCQRFPSSRSGSGSAGKPKRLKILVKSRSNSTNGAVAAGRLRLTTKSQPGGISSRLRRKNSRVRRRIRLRATALPLLRVAVRPSRQGSAAPRRRQKMTAMRPWARHPRS